MLIASSIWHRSNMSVACKAQLNAFAVTARHPYINHIAIQHIHRTFATYRDTNSGINNVSKIPSSSSTVSPRKKVTVINDDGRVPWAQLTAREKVARTTQQSFNLAIVVAGLVATVRVQSAREQPRGSRKEPLKFIAMQKMETRG